MRRGTACARSWAGSASGRTIPDRLDLLVIRRRAWWRFGPGAIHLLTAAGYRPRALPRGAATGPGRIAVTRRGEWEIAVGRPVGALMERILADRIPWPRMTALAVSAQAGAGTVAYAARVDGRAGTRLCVLGRDLRGHRPPGRPVLPEEAAAEAAIAAAWGVSPALLERVLGAEVPDLGLVRRGDGATSIARRAGARWQPLTAITLEPDGPPIAPAGALDTLDLAWELCLAVLRRMTGLDPDGRTWADLEAGADGTVWDLVPRRPR